MDKIMNYRVIIGILCIMIGIEGFINFIGSEYTAFRVILTLGNLAFGGFLTVFALKPQKIVPFKKGERYEPE